MSKLGEATVALVVGLLSGAVSGYVGGLAAQPSKISAGQVSQFFTHYYSLVVNPATRAQARDLLTQEFSAQPNNSEAEVDKTWAPYRAAEIDQVIPLGESSFQVSATYTRQDGHAITRVMSVTMACERVGGVAFLPCGADQLRLDGLYSAN
ncbi:MAG: hypothetical protein LWW77_12315 [Propionibacteriales bacterium]|nr:hypothetical protein [Propionibacteriales bacterium]